MRIQELLLCSGFDMKLLACLWAGSLKFIRVQVILNVFANLLYNLFDDEKVFHLFRYNLIFATEGLITHHADYAAVDIIYCADGTVDWGVYGPVVA